MQFRFVFGFVGVDGAQVLFGLHLVAAFHGDVFEVGIHREILSMAQNHHCIGARQLGDTGHLSFEDGASVGTFCRGDIDTVIGHRDFVRYHRCMFSVGR